GGGGGADAARSRRRGGRARAGRPGRVSRGSALPAMLLGASLVLSAGLVAGAFNPAPHSGGDNAGYVALAHTLVSQHAYVDAYDPLGAPHVKYPPIFPALMALLISAGASTWVAFKLLVAVLTVASVGVTCLWAAGRRSRCWSRPPPPRWTTATGSCRTRSSCCSR